MREQAERLLALGARAVLIKGGHADGAESVDLLIEPTACHAPGRRPHRDREHPRHRLHAFVGDRGRARPRALTLAEAVRAAKAYVTDARSRRRSGITIGSGHGPVHHFHAWW